MSKMFDLVALGELLIDYIECGQTDMGMKMFSQNPGGAVANVLIANTRLGLKTAYIGKVGRDMQGIFLKQVLEDVGVDTRNLVISEDVFTTLAFVSLAEDGERSFSFARKPGADSCLCFDEVDEKLLKNCRVFHTGSVSLTKETVRSAMIKSIAVAKAAGALISFDPNYREPLWESYDIAKKQIQSVLPEVDLLKMSEEEAAIVTDSEDIEEAIEIALNQGVRCVAVTMGKKGAYVATRNHKVHVESIKCKAVDTTGAGDAFWGGFLYRVLEKNKPIECFDENDLICCGRFANTVAGYCVQKIGAISSLPTLEQVQKM